jgi:hypothetical protein
MFFLQRAAPSDTSSLAYLFGCGGKGHAIAVDVHAEDVEWFLQQAAQQAAQQAVKIDGSICVSGSCSPHHCKHQALR